LEQNTDSLGFVAVPLNCTKRWVTFISFCWWWLMGPYPEKPRRKAKHRRQLTFFCSRLFLTLGFSVRAPRLAVASILGYARRGGAPTLARAHCSPGCCGRGNSKLQSPEPIVEVEVRQAGSAGHGENGWPIAARGNAMAR
jgi:hypothetical protein